MQLAVNVGGRLCISRGASPKRRHTCFSRPCWDVCAAARPWEPRRISICDASWIRRAARRQACSRMSICSSALTVPLLPIPIPAEAQDDEAGTALYARNTRPFNAYGLPAVSIPCGFAKNGLPIGLQIVGPPWGEESVLRLAHAFEQTTYAGKRDGLRLPFDCTGHAWPGQFDVERGYCRRSRWSNRTRRGDSRCSASATIAGIR